MGKKPVRVPLENPYNVPDGRGEIVKAILRVLEEQDIAMSPEESRPDGGVVKTKKVVFSIGTHVINDLRHFSKVEAYETRKWGKARVALTFNVEPIEPKRSQLFIMARFEGEAQGAGVVPEWIATISNGVLEQCFMEAVLEKLGITVPSAQSLAGEREDCRLCLRACSPLDRTTP